MTHLEDSLNFHQLAAKLRQVNFPSALDVEILLLLHSKSKTFQLFHGPDPKRPSLCQPQGAGKAVHARPAIIFLHLFGPLIDDPRPHDLPALPVEKRLRCKVAVILPAHSAVLPGEEAIVSVIADVELSAPVMRDEEQQMP